MEFGFNLQFLVPTEVGHESFSVGADRDPILCEVAVLLGNRHNENQLDPFSRLATLHQRYKQTQTDTHTQPVG